MKQISYVIQFRGSAGPRKARKASSGRGPAGGVRDHDIHQRRRRRRCHRIDRGNTASFESDVFPNEDGSFTESGVINFGGGHGFTFSTRGQGAMGPSADPDLIHGGICWQVDAGTGIFNGASGIITSNFTVSGTGEVVDSQWGVIFLK